MLLIYLVDLDVGKSTIAAFLFSKFKMTSKYTVEYAGEYAKDCVYEDRLNILKNDQLYIFAKQNHKLVMIKNYEKCPDFVITDSPLILSNIYGEINNSVSDKFKDLVLETFNSYTNMNFFIERCSNLKYEVNGRIQNEEEAKEIDNKIKGYLTNNNISFETLRCDDINSIYERVLYLNQFFKIHFK